MTYAVGLRELPYEDGWSGDHFHRRLHRRPHRLPVASSWQRSVVPVHDECTHGCQNLSFGADSQDTTLGDDFDFFFRESSQAISKLSCGFTSFDDVMGG